MSARPKPIIDGIRIDSAPERERPWNYEQLCAYLEISDSTAHRWVMERRIPFMKMGHLVRFFRSQIDAWLKSQTISVLHSSPNTLRGVPGPAGTFHKEGRS